MRGNRVKFTRRSASLQANRHFFKKTDDIVMEANKDFLGEYEKHLNNYQTFEAESKEINERKRNEDARTVTENSAKLGFKFINDAKNTMIYTYLTNYNKNLGRNKRNVQCFYCKVWNDHLASGCPQKFCLYCHQNGHLFRNCPKRNFCQFCGSTTHSTFNCNEPESLERMRMKYIKCHNCNRYGHYAIDCLFSFRSYNSGNQSNFNYRNYYRNNYGFNNYRGRYRGRYNYYYYRNYRY